jgi:cytosine/adenosine deaminase-related metal-dependent hydrolase
VDNKPIILVPEAVLANDGTLAATERTAVRVQGGRIVAVGASDPPANGESAEVIELPHCLLMPGLVNAHQHGRGLTALQHGLRDDFLELVIAERSGRGPLDAEPIVGLACAEMLRNGVTATLQANVTFGSPDYAAELRRMVEVYDQAGMRATVCVGAQDRAFVVYPDENSACFLGSLPAALREGLARRGSSPYMPNAGATIALMDELLSDYAGHPRIRLLYGPAGPQWLSDACFAQLADAARRQGVGFHLHCLETRAQRAALDRAYPRGVLAQLARLGVLSPGSSLAHCVYVSKDDIAVAADCGVAVAVNPGSNLRLRNGVAPVRDLLRSGIPVGIGSDNRALEEGEDLFKELRLMGAVTRGSTWDGGTPLQPLELLHIATHNGAQVVGGGGDVGAIRAGQRADLIAVDLRRTRGAYLDPNVPIAEAVLARAEGRDVRLTMVDGRILYRDGRVLSLDEDTLCECVRRTAAQSREAGNAAAGADREALRAEFIAYYRRLTAAADPQMPG